MFIRVWKTKELILIAATIFLAVTSITSVVFLTESLKSSLEDKTGALLGGDRALTSSTPIEDTIIEKTKALSLNTSLTTSFFSMLMHNNAFSLAEVEAVDTHYPLKGELRISEERLAPDKPTQSTPEMGSVWLDARLFSELGVKIGDFITIGEANFRVGAILTREPSRAYEGFMLAPRALINALDLPKTNLIQPGSRVTYKLLLSGRKNTLLNFDDWIKNHITPTQSYQAPEGGRALFKRNMALAEDYLGLIVLINIGLAGIAITITSRVFAKMQLDTVATMRAFGASITWIVSRYLVMLAGLTLLASCVGIIFGWGLYKGIRVSLSDLFPEKLTTAIGVPLGIGLATAFILLSVFVLPPIFALKNTSPLRVLRKDLMPRPIANAYVFFIAFFALLILLLLQTHNVELSLVMLLFVVGISVGIMLFLRKGLISLRKFSALLPVMPRLGLMNLTRHSTEHAIQILAFSLAMMLFWVTILIQNDLTTVWQAEIKKDTPNYFIFNIPKDKVPELESYFKNNALMTQGLYPIVRARLLSINNEVISMDSASGTERSFNRLLNITWRMTLQEDNKITQGTWFKQADIGQEVISVEQGFAERMTIKEGDKIQFQIGEKTITPIVKSIRQVTWDSFHPNFFVIFPEGVLESFPTTYTTSFYLPKEKFPLLKTVVQDFPMISIIDIEMVLNEVKALLKTITNMLKTLFGFTFLMACLLLITIILATMGQRMQESKLLRTLGATNKQLIEIHFSEFLFTGFCAGVIAIISAFILEFWFTQRIIQLAYSPQIKYLILGPLVGLCVGIMGGFLSLLPFFIKRKGPSL